MCTEAKYETNSKDMSRAIEKIIYNCCTATVLFGATQDVASLFVEAQKQAYEGEWLVGDFVVTDLAKLHKKMMANLTKKEVDEFMHGAYVLAAVALAAVGGYAMAVAQEISPPRSPNSGKISLIV